MVKISFRVQSAIRTAGSRLGAAFTVRRALMATLLIPLLAADECAPAGPPKPEWISTLRPFYSDSDVSSDNGLLGAWVGVEPNDDEPILFQGRGNGNYIIESFRRESTYGLSTQGDDDRLDVRLVKVGDLRFLDWITGTSRGNPGRAGGTTHYPMRLELSGDTLRLWLLSAKPLMDSGSWYSDSAPRIVIGSELLLRGSLEQVQNFLVRYAADSAVAANSIILTRMKLGEGPTPTDAVAASQ